MEGSKGKDREPLFEQGLGRAPEKQLEGSSKRKSRGVGTWMEGGKISEHDAGIIKKRWSESYSELINETGGGWPRMIN